MTFFLSQCLYVLFTHAYYSLLSAIVDRKTTKTYLHRYPSFFFPSLFIFPSFLQMEHEFFFFRGSHTYLVESHSNRCTMMLHCNNNKKKECFFSWFVSFFFRFSVIINFVIGVAHIPRRFFFLLIVSFYLWHYFSFVLTFTSFFFVFLSAARDGAWEPTRTFAILIISCFVLSSLKSSCITLPVFVS